MSELTSLLQIIIELTILALFNALAFWQRHIFLYILVAIGDIVFGLYYAFQTDPFTGTAAMNTPTWVIGILVVVLGFFCLFRAAMKVITERR